MELRGNKCESCGLGLEWNGASLSLCKHHVDGDRNNNAALNLKFLCPNCHSQTDNYCGGKLFIGEGNPMFGRKRPDIVEFNKRTKTGVAPWNKGNKNDFRGNALK